MHSISLNMLGPAAGAEFAAAMRTNQNLIEIKFVSHVQSIFFCLQNHMPHSSFSSFIKILFFKKNTLTSTRSVDGTGFEESDVEIISECIAVSARASTSSK